MIYRFSELSKTITSKADFDKWVDEKTAEKRNAIYDKRNEIYQREVRNELEQFASLKNAWEGMKKLRKVSTSYDLAICIDNKGYHSFVAYFPVTKEIVDKARDYREQEIARLGGDKYARASVYFNECLWEICHEKVYADFSFAVPCQHQDFPESADRLVRKFEIFRFK